MLNDYWKQFKSGTDIRGTASPSNDITKPINLTDDTIKRITLGFITFLLRKTGKSCNNLKLSVGYDSRISSNRIKNDVSASLVQSGITVFDIGLSSTPAMFMSISELKCDAAIEITASHHPFYYNGLKFFTKESSVSGKDIETILEFAQQEMFPPKNNKGSFISTDYMTTYSNSLCSIIKEGINSKSDYDHPLKGFKIVVDAGNGVGGFYAKKVLDILGADTSDSQFLKPDGMFPNHTPNPEDKEAIRSLREKVLSSNADLGVIFDTDADRAAVVDSTGKEINRNSLIALASLIATQDHPGSTIVTDSITSPGLTDFIEKDLKCSQRRFKRGYRNVIDEAKRLNNIGIFSPLAIETSGHAAFKENYFLDDGAYLVTKIIVKAALIKHSGNTLTSLIASLKEALESEEYRIKIIEKNYKEYGNMVISNLEVFAKSIPSWSIDNENIEGIRVSVNNNNGWFLLRLSVHDHVMSLNIESDINGGCREISSLLFNFLNTQKGLSLV